MAAPTNVASRTTKAASLPRAVADGIEPSEAGPPAVRAARRGPQRWSAMLFEGSLLDYQDEHEALNSIASSQPGEVLPPEVQSVEFPDDGEKRREHHRLQKVRARQGKPLQGKRRAADDEQPALKQRDENHGKLDHRADEASEASFPASDPPATIASGVGGKR